MDEEREALHAPERGYPEDWRERIEIAKRERENAKKAREGKPVTFKTYRT